MAVSFILAGTFALYAQSPTRAADDTVKITTTLIQTDVVVTDKDNKPVTDLGIGDFKVYQDGKLQKVTAVTFVNPGTQPSLPQKKIKKENSILLPMARSESGRVITFVIDDGNCLATTEGIFTMKDAINKFIDEQMLPGDKVAIYRTKDRTSLMQLYSSNKELLKKKVSRISLLGEGGCGSAFEPFLQDTLTPKKIRPAPTIAVRETDFDKLVKNRDNDDRRRQQVVGTVGVLRFVVDRLKDVPTRKSIFFLSEGIAVTIASDAYEALRELADRAARSAVVIHTLSAKGLTVPGMLTAQDDPSVGLGKTADTSSQPVSSRIDEERALNMGLDYLAYSTGGRFIRGQNFLDEALKKILDTESGYYLVAYEPDDETFKGKEFHKIDIQVERPGLRVTSRKGFYGKTDKDSRPVHKTADSPLYQALASAFDENGIDLRLTTLLLNTATDGTFVRTLIHIGGKDITLFDDSGGGKKAIIDVLAVALNDKGIVVEEFNRSYSIRIPANGVAIVQQNGLDFSTDIPFKTAGVYSFRVAVRDTFSKRVGSAGDSLDLSEMKNGKLWVSALTVAAVGANNKRMFPEKRPVDAAFVPVFAKSTASVRQFGPNSTLPYAFWIYNAQVDKSTGKPILTREVRLYKEGKLIVAGTENDINLGNVIDLQRIENAGVIRISNGIEPGEYVLQIIVRDKVANRASSQSIDFEVID